MAGTVHTNGTFGHGLKIVPVSTTTVGGVGACSGTPMGIVELMRRDSVLLNPMAVFRRARSTFNRYRGRI